MCHLKIILQISHLVPVILNCKTRFGLDPIDKATVEEQELRQLYTIIKKQAIMAVKDSRMGRAKRIVISS